jgi:hypothetical protein
VRQNARFQGVLPFILPVQERSVIETIFYLSAVSR